MSGARDVHRLLLAAATLSLTAQAFALSPQPPSPPPSDSVSEPVVPLVPPQPRIRIETPNAREPVRVQAATVQAEIVGLSVATRVEMTLYNPNKVVLSGELQFPLSEGQVVTGFALDIDGRLRDAVPVEKAKGRQVFEDVTRQRVDPALLEVTQGNFHKLKVYPLPPLGTRRVVLEIRESVAAGRQPVWRLPLAFGGPVNRLDVSIRAAQVAPGALGATLGADRLEFRPMEEGSRLDLGRSDYTGAHALQVALPAAPAQVLTSTESFRDQRYFVAEIPVQASTWPRKAPRRLGLVWDASGSGVARDHVRELALLDTYIRQLRDVEVQLVLVRNEAEPAQTFRIRGGDWTALRRALEAVAYDGATRLAGLVPPPGCDLALLFTDGLGNWGSGAPSFGKTPVFVFTASTGASGRTLRVAAEQSGGGVTDLLLVPTAQAVTVLTQERPRLTSLQSSEATDLESASLYPEAGRLVVAGVLNSPKATVRLTLSTPDGRGAARSFVVETAHPAAADAAKKPGQGGTAKASDKATTVAVAAHRWATLRLARLEADEDLHRREIHDLGVRFRIATRETSLIVLDELDDYVRYDIEPPQDLLDDWRVIRRQQASVNTRERARSIDDVVKRFNEMVAWWKKSFPKGTPPKPKTAVPATDMPAAAAMMDRQRREESQRLSPAELVIPPPEVPIAPAAAPAPAPVGDATEASRSPMAAAPGRVILPVGENQRDAQRSGPALAQAEGQADDTQESSASASISLRPWEPNEPYVRRLRDARPDQLYAIYLDERRGYLNSSAFFLDVADLFNERGEKALALRVLSNLAEMDLENRHLLRILAYRLVLSGQVADALPLLEQVRRLAPDEPQSLRDLALAKAQAGDPQAAVNLLWEIVIGEWDARFPDVDLIALNELNAIAARSAAAGRPLDLSRVDKRLRRVLPLDLRVALTWDADDTDIDLWVIDPNGEPCYFGQPKTYQGGLMSRDFTGGFGPEVFSLRQAKPGTYTVQAKFYGHRQQVVAPATTLMVKLSTGFGTPGQQDRDMVVRLSGQGDLVTIGTFTVEAKPDGAVPAR